MGNFMEIATCVVEVAILFFYTDAILERRKNLGKGIYGVFGIALLLNIARSYLFLPMNTNVMLTCVIWMAVTCICFEGTWLKKLFFIAVEITMAIASDMITSMILSFFADIEYSDVLTLRYLGMMMTNSIYFVFVIYIVHFAKKNYRHLPLKFNILMALCPLISIFLLLFLDLYMIETQKVYYIPSFLAVVGLAYINVMIFNFFDYYEKGIKVTALDALLRANEENYKLLEDNEKQLNILRHDISKHMAGIKDMMEQDNKQAAEKYVEELSRMVSENTSVSRTGNITLDTVLNVEGRRAAAAEIRYDVKLNIQSQILISSVDLSRILYNAIDNAIEACENLENKYILVSVSSDDKNVKIVIENTSAEVEVNNGSIATSKGNTRRHGYGIRSIKDAVENYDGMMSLSFSDNRFICSLMLKNEAK